MSYDTFWTHSYKGGFIAETVNRYGEFPSAGIVRQIAHEYATEALGEDA